jgi:UDP-N-acetylglucosamine--dolichyl-phosphate N-acetylglucosaminephosphotransferase
MPDNVTLEGLTISFVASLIFTFAAIRIVSGIMKRHGITGKDIHKLSKPEIPEMCGLGVILGLGIGQIVFAALFPAALRLVAAFVGTFVIAGAIGVVDDLHPLGGRAKPVLTAIACLPILVLGTFSPFVAIPLVGVVSLVTVYPIIIPIAIAVVSNAVNMMDVMNGAMPGTIAIISFTATAILFASGQWQVACMAAGLLAAMIALYYFNRYPAKVFSGDTGSLAVGAALGALAIIGKIEAPMVVSLMPHIMNSFYGLTSVRGLRERREIHQRPTKLMDNGLLQASTEKGAPVTLARLLLAAGPLSERQIVRGMMLLTAISSCLAVITYWLTVIMKS